MSFISPRGQPHAAQMTYGAPPGVVFASPPPQQQLAIVEQPQMVFAVAPAAQPQPQMQLSVRANPNNLFQGTRLRSEGPIAREELIRQKRLFEGDMERPPMVIPGQFIDLALLQAQQPQMLKELIVEQPVMQAVFASPPPAMFAQEMIVNGAAPQLGAAQYVLEEPTAMNGMSQYATVVPVGEVFMGQPALPQPMPQGRPSVQYAGAPAGSVMVEEVLYAQPAPGSGVVFADPWGPPDLNTAMTKQGTMVMMAPEQQGQHLVTATPVQQAQQAVLSGRKGTITNALFDLIDINADGKITRSEFRRGLKGEIIQPGQAGFPVR